MGIKGPDNLSNFAEKIDKLIADQTTKLPKSSNAVEEIQNILGVAFSNTLIHDKLYRTIGYLIGYDPTASIRKAIDLAKQTGDPELLKQVYKYAVKFSEENRYTYNAAEYAIEAGDLEKAMQLIYRLVNWQRNPDYYGANRLGQQMGPEYLKKVEKAIKDSEDEKKRVIREKNAATKAQFEAKEQRLSKVSYKTKSGSKYQINQDKIIFRNDEPVVIEGDTYIFIGVGNLEEMRNAFDGQFGYGGESDKLTYYQAYYYLNNKKPFVTKIPFAKVKDYLDKGFCLIGINEKKKELYRTTEIKE